MLDANIKLRLDRLNLDADVRAGAGEVLALLGPNGAGKSTVLRALAGLLRLAGGRVAVDGVVLEEPGRHIRIAPEKRPVSLMFQDYLLFPHLSALENVAFGLRARGVDRRDARNRAAAALDRLGVGQVASSRPGAMSGGQQQRVAMARALVTEPALLLLDEPLAALDVSTKADVRRQLRVTLRSSRAANVLVTHDLLDAVSLADRMLVIEGGGIVQSGTPAEVTARPRSQYVADLVGVNLLRGTARGAAVDLDGGGRLVIAGEAAGQVLVVVAPAAVAVQRERPAAGGQRERPAAGGQHERPAAGGQHERPAAGANVWPGQVGAVDLLGDRVRVRVEGTPPITAEVLPSAVDELKLDDGGQLWASVEPSAVRVYPP
jgi:molybdate transport system ATP-binding protein